MHATSAIAALLDPFAAVQGASGVGGASASSGPANGLFGDAGDEQPSDGGQFGDALAAAMAAALGAPAPVLRPTTPASVSDGEAAGQASVGRQGAQPVAFAALTAQLSPAATHETQPAGDEAILTPSLALSPTVGTAPAQAPAAEIAVPHTATAPLPSASAPKAASEVAPAPLNASAPQPERGPPAEAVVIPDQAQAEAAIVPRAHTPAPQAAPRGEIATATQPLVKTEASVQAAAAAAASPAETSAKSSVVPALTPPAPNPAQSQAQTPAPASATAAASPAAAPVTPATTSPGAQPPVQTAQVTATQAPAPVKTNTASPAQPGSRVSKAKAEAASVEARPDRLTAGSQAEEVKQGLTINDDDAPVASPLLDDQLQDAEPQADRPNLTAQAPAASEQRAIQAPVVDTPRATPQTVALLAAQIANKVDGKTTRFDVQLDPHGLGKVDVRVEISARGEVSAALTFENPQAASELRGKAGELQAALEQAGFDLSKTSLSFNSGGQGQHQGLFDQQQQNQAPVWRGRAFTDLSDTPEAAPAPVQRRAAAGGVDVRI